MQNNNSKLNTILLIILIILVGIGIWVFIKNGKGAGDGARLAKEIFNTNSLDTLEQSKDDVEKPDSSFAQDGLTSSYANNQYGFSFVFPKTYTVTLGEGMTISCTVVDSVNEQGFSYGHSKVIDIVSGVKVPLSFYGESFKDRPDIVFGGNIGYKLSPECDSSPLVSVLVISKPPYLNFSDYLNAAARSVGEGVSQGATGGGASVVYVNVNGKQIPVVRSRDGSVMGNTSDTYYFEKGNYLFALNHQYSEGIISLTEAEIEEYYSSQYEAYQISKQIINGFSFIK